MPTFDHNTDENEFDRLFFQLQYDLSTSVAAPPESLNHSSYLAHYSLYPYMFDEFVILVVP